MNATRRIKKVFKSKQTIEGAGVHLKRAFGFSEIGQFDPFLLLDDFRSGNPKHYSKGFPWHPHRGIETITYILQGNVEHGDSLGNKGIIASGDVQWMTAGSGIIHQEMPKGDASGRMEGFQLWANLPAAEKMMPPRYRDVKSNDIPVITLENDVQIKIICGKVNNSKGPVQDIITDPVYLDVTVPAHTVYLHPTKQGHTVFAYVIAGQGYFCKEKKPFTFETEGENYFDMETDPLASNGTLVLFADGNSVHIETGDQGIRFLLISGKPLGEPVAWRGPIVMNTQEELRLAFDEYREGTFLKHKSIA
ncbi:MAG: pirin [Desulfobacterales bacterium SG8_35_2]|jgi:redox-sensitive bicupin YhaK (pirin superfamily)|nr:MAG: pirin [Desulfobacterales bacterium SG8_35_2]